MAALAAAVCCSLAQAAPGATSADGRWRVEGLDRTVVVRDGDRTVKTLPARSLSAADSGRAVSMLYLPRRRSFAIGFDAGLPELWELSVDPDAPAVFDGLVHDYRMGEAVASPGFLGVRRTRLDATVLSFVADASNAYLLALASDGSLVLLNLDVRRAIARWAIADADPDLAAAQAVGSTIVVPDRRGTTPLVIDVRAPALRR